MMIKKRNKEKAQVSIEVIVMLGVLIIGAIVVSIFLVNSYNKNVSQSSEVDGQLTNVVDGFIDDLNQPTGGGAGGGGGSGTTNYTLNVTVIGSGTVSGNGINCSGTCSLSFEEDTEVTLTAIPSTGYTFTSWTNSSGTVMSIFQSYTFNMPANNYTLTAIFDTVSAGFSWSVISPTVNAIYNVNEDVSFKIDYSGNTGAVMCSFEIFYDKNIFKSQIEDCEDRYTFTDQGNYYVIAKVTHAGTINTQTINFKVASDETTETYLEIIKPENNDTFTIVNFIDFEAVLKNYSGNEEVICTWTRKRYLGNNNWQEEETNLGTTQCNENYNSVTSISKRIYIPGTYRIEVKANIFEGNYENYVIINVTN